jgi:hypothetical protein
MARPAKNNADYFSHDNDMRNNDKIKAVRRRFGHEGYSVWNMILEKLCHAGDFTLKYNDINIELWAGDFEADPVKLKEMIDYFLKLELLINHEGMIFSEAMIMRFNPLMDKRKRSKEKFLSQKQSTKEVSDAGNPHSKGKDSKVNKSKVKQSKDNNDASGEAPPESLYKRFISVYDQFIKLKTDCPAKIDGTQGKAAKEIIKYLQGASKDKSDEGVVNTWNYILSNWSRLEPFKQKKLKLSEINTDLINIINELKNGAKGKQSINSEGLDSLFDQYVTAKQQAGVG